MKNRILTLTIFLLGFLIQNALGQTSATGTIIQVPCDNDGIYSVSTTGLTPPITYTYYLGNSSVVHSNINSTSDQLTNFPMTNYGSIYCTAYDGSAYASAQNSYPPDFTFTTQSTPATCPATMGTVSATQTSGVVGPFSYNWTNTQTSVSYSGNNIQVPLGEYRLQVSDLTTGCVSNITDSSLFVYQNSGVYCTANTTPASCNNGTATATGVGGTPPYSYLWSNGATTQTVNGLSQGTYSVLATDANGCVSGAHNVYILQNPTISVIFTASSATCVQSDGSAIAFGSGGIAPYTYSWSNGQTGNTASNLTGGNSYTVIVTDANGCTGQGSTYINSSTPVTVSFSSTPSQCTSATGSATLAATGGTAPYTYYWNVDPTLNNPTINNLGPGNYSFKVTDAVGCVRTGSVVVSPISTINLNVSGQSVYCPATTGNVNTSVSGTNPPFTFLWNNGATTSQLSGVPLGSYYCTVTDALGCSATKSSTVKSVSPLSIGISTTPASCVFATDGAANATLAGGLAPYTYAYSNGSATANANALGVGDYSLTVTDANGCSSRKYFTISNANTSTSCYCTISGNVYLDANLDCIKDPGENGIKNIQIHCSGIGYDYTDANGDYSFQVPSGTYTITQQVKPYYPLATCQSNGIPVTVVAGTGCNTPMDFANDVVTIHDLKIVTVNSNLPPIPGNNYQQKVIVTNVGTVTETDVQLGYEHDGQLSFTNTALASFLQPNSVASPNYYGVQTGFPSIDPTESSTVLLNYSTPTNIPIGTVVDFIDTVADVATINVNWLLDNTPWNNVNQYQAVVIGSYDPNYKEVTPRGEGVEGFFTSDVVEFDYTIHFQNEGTYFANKVVITDQLDSDFDWSTFKPGYSDYDFTTTMTESGLVSFTFENINLPWKDAYGDALSSGLVTYSIERNSSVPQGTEFTNEANIYFDYNAPITTNTTLNTLKDIEDTTGIHDEGNGLANAGTTIDLFPIPANNAITLRVHNKTNNKGAMFQIVDVMGKVVFSDNIELNDKITAKTFDISKLTKGAYFTQIQFDDGSRILKKIILQ